MKRILQSITCSILLFCTASGSHAQTADQIFKAAGSPANPKVQVSWNHYNDHAGIGELLKRIVKAYPGLAKLESVGKSYDGRELWCIAVTDYSKGEAGKKPGMYIDGNIHSNEVQGAEFAMYTAWYLTESFNDTKFIRELLADKIFYIIPTINPDGRESFFKKPNNAHSPRSGVVPVDNDKDGQVDEDGYDDLDNDGNITMMRRKSANGRYRVDPVNPNRMIEAGNDEKGEYEMLGFEGIDNDGDGLINEDGEQFEYDPNRDWGWNWQPNYVQGGAFKYPFSLPENRALMEFVMKHPNIAAAQSFHNAGGMILRGPGAMEDAGTYNAADAQVYDAIGKKGEEIIPGYKYLVVYKDLYSVFGGELDWFYGGRGIYTYSNELWTPYLMFNKDASRDPNEDDNFQFDRYLLFKDAFVEWHEYNHPQYGKIEIGGFKKNFTRMHPGFLMESDAHRNMAFCIYHAYHTPKLEIDSIMEKDLGDGLKEVTVLIGNKRLLPTHSSQDLKYKIERPDYITLTGAKVIAGMVVDNANPSAATEQKNNPQTIEVSNIPGLGAVTVRWIVQATAKYTVTVDSRKGGVVSKSK
ncbi:MAG: M14 family metallopeptidase [Chitinophagaceae bacterium]